MNLLISIIYSTKSSISEQSVLLSFYRGCQKIGIPCYFGTKYKKAKIFVTYGIYKKYGTQKSSHLHNHIINYEKDGSTNIVVERGFVRREHHFMVGVGGLNGRAQFFAENSPPDRYWKLKEFLGEWKIPVAYNKILFALQVPTDSAVQHINYPNFIKEVGIHLIKACKKCIIRKHPAMPTITKGGEVDIIFNKTFENIKLLMEFGATVSHSHLYKDLNECDLVINFNSNVGVLSTIYGRPNICLDKGSMVYDICSTSLEEIDDPKISDRKQWIYDLCYKQWNKHEMRQGIPQRRIFEKLGVT